MYSAHVCSVLSSVLLLTVERSNIWRHQLNMLTPFVWENFWVIQSFALQFFRSSLLVNKFNINLVIKYMKSSKTKKKRIQSNNSKPTSLSKLMPSKVTDPYGKARISLTKKSAKSTIKSIQPTNRERMHTSNY